MKRILRIAALICAMAMLLGTVCGCSAFVDGFMAGYNDAMAEDTTDTAAEEQPPLFDDDSSLAYAADPVFFTPEDAAEIFSKVKYPCTSEDIQGRWVDRKNNELEFLSDNSVCLSDADIDTYDSYSFDGAFLYLYKDGEESKYAARLFGDMLVIYSDFYSFIRIGEGSGLTGQWKCISHDGYSFVFRDDGTYTEDDALNGIYCTEGSDILLSYDDGSAEICLYILNGENDDYLLFSYGHVLDFAPQTDEVED